MRTSLRICAVAATIALGSAPAWACDDDCGYGYNGYIGYSRYNGYNGYNGYYGYNGHSRGYNGYYYAPPVYTYAPPPVYYAPTAYTYYVPVAVYGGPRQGCGDAGYCTAPVACAPLWRRSRACGYSARRRFYARPHRVYARAPVFRRWRRW